MYSVAKHAFKTTTISAKSGNFDQNGKFTLSAPIWTVTCIKHIKTLWKGLFMAGELLDLFL